MLGLFIGIWRNKEVSDNGKEERMRIGRYRILFNPHRLFWFQTHKPIVARQWWWFLILHEVDIAETTKRKRFKLGTKARSISRRYVYCKFGSNKVESDIEL